MPVLSPLLYGADGRGPTRTYAIAFHSSLAYDTIFAGIFRSSISACPSTWAACQRQKNTGGCLLSKGGSHGCQEKDEVFEG